MALIKLNNQSISAVSALPSGVGGKVLQVKQMTKTDSSTYSLATDTLTTFMTQTITPSSTSSKILASFIVYTGNPHPFGQPYIVLRRGGSDIFRSDTVGNRKNSTAGANYCTTGGIRNLSQSFLDSPSSVSSLSYTLNLGGYNSNTFYINIPDTNDAQHSTCTSTFTLMEVGA